MVRSYADEEEEEGEDLQVKKKKKKEERKRERCGLDGRENYVEEEENLQVGK